MLDVRRCLDHLVRKYKFVQSDPVDVARHDRMAPWWSRSSPYINISSETSTPHEKTALQRQIEAKDGQIDALVYELYGLTADEIGIVQKASR